MPFHPLLSMLLCSLTFVAVMVSGQYVRQVVVTVGSSRRQALGWFCLLAPACFCPSSMRDPSQQRWRLQWLTMICWAAASLAPPPTLHHPLTFHLFLQLSMCSGILQINENFVCE